MIKNISILGATGSIGESTLKVIAQHQDKYKVFAVSAYQQIDKLVNICKAFEPKYAVVPDNLVIDCKEKLLAIGSKTIALAGETGLTDIASHDEVDMVMAAIVGAAGLAPTYAAIKAGKRILLANKETLVMAGDLMLQAAQVSGADILPVDSEHNAIFQCLPQDVLANCMQQGNYDTELPKKGFSHISLTASGGPFLTWSAEQIQQATVAQACKHPNWSMGRKISVDSASLMNKGLELIEACYLFGVPESKIEVIIHPESIIHSAVHYTDGSVLAELGNPDMCTPIAHAMAWPERIKTEVAPLSFTELAQLNFMAPDHTRFPCLNLARSAVQSGQSAPAVLNAANEMAVAAFLEEKIGFTDIAKVNEAVLTQVNFISCNDIDTINAVDEQARSIAAQYISQI